MFAQQYLCNMPKFDSQFSTTTILRYANTVWFIIFISVRTSLGLKKLVILWYRHCTNTKRHILLMHYMRQLSRDFSLTNALAKWSDTSIISSDKKTPNLPSRLTLCQTQRPKHHSSPQNQNSHCALCSKTKQLLVLGYGIGFLQNKTLFSILALVVS